MTLDQLVKRTGIGTRTVKKYLNEGLIPSHLASTSKNKWGTDQWEIHEDAIPWFERILSHNLEKIHGCNPALWAVRKLESDRKRGLIE